MFARCTNNNTVLLRSLMVFTRSMSSYHKPAPVNTSNSYCTRKTFAIADNVSKSRFEMQIGVLDIAFIEYVKEGEVYDLVETMVPDKYKGQGLGKALAQKTFNHIISQNATMKLSCDFLKYYYSQNEAIYKDHVV